MAMAKRPGFSRVDLLVVCAVVVLLLGSATMLVVRVHIAADKMRCQNNLKQIVLALHNFHDVNNSLPANPDTLDGRTGTPFYFVLPYME
jgi:hypothetical protein